MTNAFARVRHAWPDLYIGAVAVAGTAAIGASLLDRHNHPLPPIGLILVALTLVSGIAMLRMPSVAASFSISDAFTIAVALAFGPSAATLVVALDSLAISWRLARRALTGRRALFNATAPPFAMWLAAWLFFSLTGVSPLSEAPVVLTRLAVPAALFTVAYFLLNTGLIAYAIAVSSGERLLQIWREHFSGLWLSYFAGALVAVVLVLLVYGETSSLLVILVLVPLPLALHAIFKTDIRRLEGELAHLDKVNRLYQSTVDTLAHAIDAKDQVTHGHIQRVQRRTQQLAAIVGLGEDDLRALEAAALLHDTGKLAIPEHILNKPGKLTEAEFAVMKRHADIGADILSRVDFPFPVVPIVRHHHENWDGTGYPDGLKGRDIPIGARILSVVDCFDALTSDRPYRRRHANAVSILRERRGTMYDPDIVDAFITAHNSGAFEQDDSSSAAVTDSIGALPHISLGGGRPSSRDDALHAIFECGRLVSLALEPDDLCARAHGQLRRIMPVATCVLYLDSDGSGQLRAVHRSGLHAAALADWRIAIGERLSGWVVANRRSIVNSDAALDLEGARLDTNPPRLCLSVPLVTEGEAIGALTLYSLSEPFAEADPAVVGIVANGIAPALARPAQRRGA